MPAILCVGDELALNRSRAAVLRSTGCAVSEGHSSDAQSFLASQSFDLVMLCHTIPVERALEILRAAKKLAPAPQLVVIDTPFGDSELSTEATHIDPFAGPLQMVEEICGMLSLGMPCHKPPQASPAPRLLPPLEKRRQAVGGVSRLS